MNCIGHQTRSVWPVQNILVGLLFSLYHTLIPVKTVKAVSSRYNKAPGRPDSLRVPRYSLWALPASPKSVLMMVLSACLLEGSVIELISAGAPSQQRFFLKHPESAFPAVYAFKVRLIGGDI